MGKGAKDNWEEFDHRLKQADLDASVFKSILQRVKDFHQVEVERLRSQAALADEKAAAAEAVAARAIREARETINESYMAFQRKAEDIAKAAEKSKEMEVAEGVAVARSEALGLVDKVRLEVNALSRAFSQRSEERRSSHTAHKLATGTFALEAAFDAGSPLKPELDLLAAGAGKDPLVSAALASIPPDAASQGVASREELQAEWPRVSQRARRLGLIQEGQGGLLSVGLASIAAWLKVPEVHMEGETSDAPSSIDEAVAKAGLALQRGDLLAAADTLERVTKGTAAASSVGPWVEAARSRAVTEQAVRLLQAHAATISSSLS
eukprot:jgi/Botrbrau1/22956/Bobra.0030s0028.1